MEDGPKSKMRKIADGATCSPNPDSIFSKFFADDETFELFMTHFQFLLRNRMNGFLPSVIQSCDAASVYGHGKSFPHCECYAVTHRSRLYHFGAFFDAGVEIYNTLMLKKIPQDPLLKKATSKLLTYLLEEIEWHQELIKIEDSEYVTSEAQVVMTLAEHYFKRLSLTEGYTVDKHSPRKIEAKGKKKHAENCCKCEKCASINVNYDDTSIGNNKVWHGHLDLVFDSQGDVAVKIAKLVKNPTDDEKMPNGANEIEFKKMENINLYGPRNQIISQAIIWSFLHKQRHPESEHFLVPCIIASNDEFKVFFYDAEHDILLESKAFKFTYRNSVRYESLIAAWLVLNHKVLCTGAYTECLESAPKSNFRDLVGNSVSIYENELSFRNVKPGGKPISYDDDWLVVSLEDKTEWPESKPKPIK